MFSEWEAAPAQGAHERACTWENPYDDGSRLDRLAHHTDLLRLDECGPPVQDAHVR